MDSPKSLQLVNKYGLIIKGSAEMLLSSINDTESLKILISITDPITMDTQSSYFAFPYHYLTLEVSE